MSKQGQSQKTAKEKPEGITSGFWRKERERAQRPLAFSRKSLSRNGKQVARVQGLPCLTQKEKPEGITFGFLAEREGFDSRCTMQLGQARLWPATGSPFTTAPLRIPESSKTKRKTRRHNLRVFGGKRGIRTLGAFIGHTRFPVVRLRPAQPSFHTWLSASHPIAECFIIISRVFAKVKHYF